MDRRAFLTTLTVVVCARQLTARAQQPAKVIRIGILGTYSSAVPEVAPLWDAFAEGLRELGYVEGKNITFERRFMEGRPERLPMLAGELVRLNVDVIVAGGQPPPVAAKRATTTIPIVMTNFSDPVGLGLVASLPRPGGNVTGLALLTVELVGKQLQLLKEAIPRASRVGFLSNPTNPGAALQLQGARSAAHSLGLQLQQLEAQSADGLAAAFSAMTREHAQAVLLAGDSQFFVWRKQIADLAIASRLPALFAAKEFAEAGGFMSYGADIAHLYHRAAAYVHKILKGASPAELPVEQPVKYELVVNLKTAKALGQAIPATLLARADKLIE